MGSEHYRRWATFIVRHRHVVIALLTIASAILALGIPRLRLEVDPDANLPQDHESIRALRELNQRFGDKNLVVIGLFPNDRDVFTPSFLTKITEVSGRIRSMPGAIQPLFQSLASPAIQHVEGLESIDEDGAREVGLAVQPVVPAGVIDATEAARVRERVRANPALVGTLVSAQGDAVAIYATFDLTEEIPSYEVLYASVLAEVEAVHDGTFEYALSGPVVLAGALGVESAGIAAYLPLSLLLIALIHYHAFRTVQAIVLPLLTAVLAVVWAVGAMGLLDVPLDPFTTTTPILILAVGAGHAVQILKRYYEEYAKLHDNQAAVIESIAQIGPVMVAAGTIAAVALLSLVFFDLSTVRTFGLFGALGILSTLVIELTLIPAVRSVLRAPAEDEARRESGHTLVDRVLDRLTTGMLGSWPTPILTGAVLLLVGCLMLASRIDVDTSFKRSFAPGTDVYDHDQRLNETFAGTNTLVLLIEGPEPGAILTPAGLHSIEALERDLEKLPGVGKATSIVDTLRYLHRALVGDPKAPLPGNAELAAQVLLLYEIDGGSVASEITPDNRIAKVVVLLDDDSTRFGTERMADARELLARNLPKGFEARIAGTLASNAALTEVVVDGKLVHIAQVAAVTLVVASLLLQSLLAGILVVVPLLLAVAIDFGFMGAAGIPLDVVTAPVTALAVGIGADYAAYFLFRLREEISQQEDFAAALRATYATSGKAIVFVASAISVGYGALCVSSFSVHRQLGALVTIAMIAASVGSLTVLPALVRLAYQSRFRRALVGSVLERHSGRA